MLRTGWAGLQWTAGVDLRVENVEHGVDDVGDEVDVALPAAPSRVHAERLLGGEAQEQQFGVVDVELVGGLPLARALLQIRVVSAAEEDTFTQRSKRGVGCCRMPECEDTEQM